MAILLVFPLIGAVSGLLAGLFGIGGGLVIVPALNAIFIADIVGVDPALRMHVAIGSSLGIIVFTAMSSVRAHHRLGSVVWPAVRGLVPGILVGGLAGAAIADHLGTRTLEIVFGSFAALMAARLAMGSKADVESHGDLPGMLGFSVAGTVIGGVSALVGIGGGIMTVPYLAWHSVAMRKAVGTAAACTLPVALAGAAGYVIAGSGSAVPAGSTGYLYWPAIAGVAVASVFTAPLGARLAHALPVRRLRQLFALLLIVVALDMVLRGG